MGLTTRFARDLAGSPTRRAGPGAVARDLSLSVRVELARLEAVGAGLA
jgi:hypothetical protein